METEEAWFWEREEVVVVKGRCEEWRKGKLRLECNVREKNTQKIVEGTKTQFSGNKHRIYNLNAKITIVHLLIL